jgi:hypothetical protein
LLEITTKGVIDHPFPGLDIEALTVSPSNPDVLYLGLEGPNAIQALYLQSMSLVNPVPVSMVMGAEHQLDAMAFCPRELCGSEGGSSRFMVAGPSNNLRVLDLGSYPSQYPLYGAKLIDKIDLDALLCRRMPETCLNRTGRVTDLHITDRALYAVVQKKGKDGASELVKVPWSATATSKLAGAPEQPQIFSLPPETKGGWQGFTIKQQADTMNSELAILANDFHGFVKEFRMSSGGLIGTC